MKSKWFTITAYKKFNSKRKAKNLTEAWDKTIEKWELICTDHIPIYDVNTCGLCNLFFRRGCLGCPIREVTGLKSCNGTAYCFKRKTKHRANLEYLFLLFVREATK